MSERIDGWISTIFSAQTHAASPRPNIIPYENDPWINASHALLDCSVSMNLALGVAVPDTGPLAVGEGAARSGAGAWIGVSDVGDP